MGAQVDDSKQSKCMRCDKDFNDKVSGSFVCVAVRQLVRSVYVMVTYIGLLTLEPSWRCRLFVCSAWTWCGPS